MNDYKNDKQFINWIIHSDIAVQATLIPKLYKAYLKGKEDAKRELNSPTSENNS